MTQAILFDAALSKPTRFSRLIDIAEKMGHDVQFAEGVAEPGYDDKPAVLGNWNERRDPKGKATDNTMPRLATLFEKLGLAVEWDDEWAFCQRCNRIIRIQGDSYSWRAYCWLDPANCELLCGDCVKDCPTDYLGYLSGNDRDCMTLDIDLEKYGYKLYLDDYEAGWYNRDDNPKDIAKGLREAGITDFIFQLDRQGQFATGFSVWVNVPSGCYGIGDPVTLCQAVVEES